MMLMHSQQLPNIKGVSASALINKNNYLDIKLCMYEKFVLDFLIFSFSVNS